AWLGPHASHGGPSRPRRCAPSSPRPHPRGRPCRTVEVPFGEGLSLTKMTRGSATVKSYLMRAFRSPNRLTEDTQRGFRNVRLVLRRRPPDDDAIEQLRAERWTPSRQQTAPLLRTQRRLSMRSSTTWVIRPLAPWIASIVCRACA